MAVFRIDLRTRLGVYVASIPFANLQGEFRMNEPSQIRFETSSLDIVNYVDVSLVRAGAIECALYRDNVLIFAGPIWNISVTSDTKVMKFAAEDISSYLKQRLIGTDTKFTKRCYAYMAWHLIDNAQNLTNGDMGITLGITMPTTWPKGSRKYTRKSGTNLYSAIDKLASGTNGFDWEVTPNREFKMYYPRIQTQSRVRLEYGGAIKNYSVQDMGKFEYNSVFIRGGKKRVSTTYVDSTARSLFGLRQFSESKTSITSVSKLNSYAKSVLNLRKNPRLIPQLTVDTQNINPFDGDIGFGYLADTVIDDGWVQFNGTMRCSGFQLTVGAHGQETFVIYMNDTREIQE